MPDMNEIVAQLKAGLDENLTAIQAEHGRIAVGALVSELERIGLSTEDDDNNDVRACFCLAALYSLGREASGFDVEFNGAEALKWSNVTIFHGNNNIPLQDREFYWAHKLISLKSVDYIKEGAVLFNEWLQTRIRYTQE